jgi:serine/threonine protein kinase
VAGTVSDLMAFWQEERGKGRHLSPEEVCAAHPELLPEVRPQIEALSAMESLLGVAKAPPAGSGALRANPGPPNGDLPLRDTLPCVGPETSSPTVPGYEILRELGRGGMGVVYKARHLGLDRIVALKMILVGEYAGAQERARFRSEAETVARLQHPNIVQIHEVGEQGGRAFFSLEFAAGGSLAQKIAAAPPSEAEAAGLVETLARAMHAAHERGVVHRDLKPANVLLTADGTPKIADFGLAKRLDADARHTRSGAVLGTPSYMAPEQASGKGGAVGPPADVYALGAILYELLTGRPPFRADTPWDTVVLVLTEDPVPPSRLRARVPHDLETICLMCLEKEPAKR